MKALVYLVPAKKAAEERLKLEVTAPTDAIVKITKTPICADLRILKGHVASSQPGRTLSSTKRLSQHLAWLLVLVILPLSLAGCGVNAIPTEQEQAKASWGDVQNQYQRRSDLIPNLVSTVQGYAQQERDVLISVTEARAQATRVAVDASTITDPEAFARFEKAQAQLSGVLGRLLAITENYPDLKSNQNFLTLQSQLEGTENRISIARRDFNGAVRQYNTELRTVPGVIWASTIYRSAKPMQNFAATPNAQTTPQVSFPGTAPKP